MTAQHLDKSIATIMARANKRWGDGTLIYGSALKSQEVPRTTTGSLTFDLMLGGGWPLNKWNEIVGLESHGKTAMVLKTIAANQAANPNFTTLWVASEDFVPTWAEQLGVDLDHVILAETNITEEAYQIILDVLEARAVDAVVLDSYPALVPSSEDDKDMAERTVGLGALLTAQFMRKSGKSIKRSLIDPSDRPVLGIIINQWRDKIGVMYGDPRTTPGGKAKNFSFFTRVEVSRRDWIEHGSGDNKAKVGITLKARSFKNKTYRSHITGEVDFYFADAGPFHAGDYDVVKEMFNVAVVYGIIERAGAWYSYGEEKWNGKEAAFAQVREDVMLQASLTAEVMRIVLHDEDAPVVAVLPVAKPKRKMAPKRG